MLIYSPLHLTGYDPPMSESAEFPSATSFKTPGHLESGLHRWRVETTNTGPLSGVLPTPSGWRRENLAAQFNRPSHDIADHFTPTFLMWATAV